MSGPDDEDLGGFGDLGEIDGADPVEQALRWRLVLGRFAAASLDGVPKPEGSQGRGPKAGFEEIDRALEYVYDREFARRSHRRSSAGEGPAGLTVPAWLSEVRRLFDEDAVAVIERDALVRYGMTELVTDPELLRRAKPSPDLLRAILQFKHLMKGEVLHEARRLVGEVVETLREQLNVACGPALHGAVDPDRRPPRRTFQNTAWTRTIRHNLKNWDAVGGRLVADRIFFRHRQRARPRWRVIIAVDQSGSMLDSLIHSAVMAAIFARLSYVSCHLVLWDHRIADVSEVAADPLEVLMGATLGGGTHMLPAMRYCAEKISEPERTIFVLISDWYVWSHRVECLALARELAEAGVRGIGLSALDTDCKPLYDEDFARRLAEQGWFVGALTPKQLAERVGKIVA